MATPDRPDLTDAALEEIEARANAASHGAEVWRYEHGGGRMAIIEDDDTRKLVADLYHEEDREFYARALADVYDLLDAVRTARAELAVMQADLREAAGECLIPMPEPGTDLARLCIANRLMRRERDTARAELARVSGMLHEVETRCDRAGEVRERVCASETARALWLENEELRRRG